VSAHAKRKLILSRSTLRVMQREAHNPAAENTKNGNTCAAPCQTGLAGPPPLALR
jgi:hypothetical protein